MASCTHPQRLGNLCAVCGAVLDGEDTTEQVAARASTAALSVTSQEAEAVAGARQSRLDTQRKLQLVLDLDHTLLECSTDPRASSVEGVVSLGNVAGRPHWVRLRPGLREFFDAVRPLYELAIYTHGSRAYAAGVAKALIERCPGTSFGGRVVSRDDCPDLRGEKSLARLFPGGAARALILDDRLDVWTRGVDQTARVLVVQPYKFFEHYFRNPERRDGDAQLSHSARALCAAHAAFYPSNGGVEDDVVACLDRSRTLVFAGCALFFAEEVDVYAARCAERYGARLVEDPADATHVVSRTRPDHDEKKWAHLDWFWYCVWRCRRESAERYRPSQPAVNGSRKRARSPEPVDEDDDWAADLEEELFS